MHNSITLSGPGRNSKNQYLTQNFIRNQAIIQVFRGFDWLSSVSDSKVMAKKLEKN